MAELGDVWHPVVLTPPAELNPAELGEQRKVLESLYEERGRDPATIRIAPKTQLHFTDDGRTLFVNRFRRESNIWMLTLGDPSQDDE